MSFSLEVIKGIKMKAKELYEEIRSYCQANADMAIVKKYSKYFKEGYDAYGLSREKLEDKVNSILSDKKVNTKPVLSASRHLVRSGKYEETSFAEMEKRGASIDLSICNRKDDIQREKKI
ncbi:MAG: hypothetical protein WAV28_08895 [Sedimentisphaerales bacterium]